MASLVILPSKMGAYLLLGHLWGIREQSINEGQFGNYRSELWGTESEVSGTGIR